MLEMNKVYNENNLITLSKMEDNFIDLIVTSPPYSDIRFYGKEGYKYNFKLLSHELYRVLKISGVIVWVEGDKIKNGDKSGKSFLHSLYFKKIGFKLFDVIIYEKSGVTFPHVNRYHNCFEYMFILSKKTIPKTINIIQDRKNNCYGEIYHSTNRQPDGRLKRDSGVINKTPIRKYGYRFNIWKYSVGGSGNSYKEKYVKGHPAVFPEKLAQDHIISWSNKFDIVYDPFMGSGTVAKMCILNDRNFIGSEIDKDYCDICNKRIEDAYKSRIIDNL